MKNFCLVLLGLMTLCVCGLSCSERDVSAAQPVVNRNHVGFMAGEADGVAAKIEFRGDGRATWRLVYDMQPGTTDIISADLILVEDREAGAILLRFDSGVASTVIGRVERDAKGTHALTVLPAAAEISESYRPVEAIPLEQVPEQW